MDKQQYSKVNLVDTEPPYPGDPAALELERLHVCATDTMDTSPPSYTSPNRSRQLSTVFSPSQHLDPHAQFYPTCNASSEACRAGAGGGGNGGGEMLNYKFLNYNPPDSRHLGLPTPSPHAATAVSPHARSKPPRAIPETYLVLALIVSCFFNLPFGLVGVCVSLSARRAYEAGNVAGGDWRAIMSLCFSLLGIFFTALFIIILITLLLYSDGSGRT